MGWFSMLHVRSTSHCAPRLQLTMSPLRQVVHVLEQLWPSHHAWSRVWRYEVRASAFGVGADLLAHVYADSSELVLNLHAVGKVLCEASLFVLRTLLMNTCERRVGALLQLRCLL